MFARAKLFFRDNNGATAIEYALIAAGNTDTNKTNNTNLGTQVKTLFSNVNNAMN